MLIRTQTCMLLLQLLSRELLESVGMSLSSENHVSPGLTGTWFQNKPSECQSDPMIKLLVQGLARNNKTKKPLFSQKRVLYPGFDIFAYLAVSVSVKILRLSET